MDLGSQSSSQCATVGLCSIQLHLHCFPQGRPTPEDQIEVPIRKDRDFEPCLLWVCCGWEHLIKVPPGVVQSGCGCYNAVFHRLVRLLDDLQEGSLDHLWLPCACCWWGGDCQWGGAREKFNSMNLLLYMSPIAIVALIPATIIMEPTVLQVFTSLGMQYKFMWLLLLINSAMAYSANLANFLVTKHTSALTLQVLGNAKGAVAVVISILLFRNPVTVVGIGGYTNRSWGGCIWRG